MRRWWTAVMLALAPAVAMPAGPPSGVIVASVGDQVVLAAPDGGRQVALPTGPVAWLFPAPGGVVFAPDLTHGRTTVVDLRGLRIRDRMEAVTMPHFGTLADRYVAVLGDLLVLSYPERAVLARIDARIEHPWQVVISSDDQTVLVLDRRPDGVGGASLVAVHILERQVALRRSLGADVVRMALSEHFGLLALAEPTERRIVLVEPGTVTALAQASAGGEPMDVVFAGHDDQLISAVADEAAGVLRRWRLRRHHDALELDAHGELALAAAPVRMDLAPDGAQLAVALSDGTVDIVNVRSLRIVGSLRLPGQPRDLRWCDPSRQGPLLPEWSDESSPEPPSLGSDGP